MTTDWTEAHQREALRRTYELAAELVAEDRLDDARILCTEPLRLCVQSERGWRTIMAESRLDPARIDREVAIVRERAERTTPPPTACDGCEFVYGPHHVTPPCKHQMQLTPEEIDAIRATYAEGKAAYEAKDGARMSVKSALIITKVPALLATLDARDAEVVKLRAADKHWLAAIAQASAKIEELTTENAALKHDIAERDRVGEEVARHFMDEDDASEEQDELELRSIAGRHCPRCEAALFPPVSGTVRCRACGWGFVP